MFILVQRLNSYVVTAFSFKLKEIHDFTLFVVLECPGIFIFFSILSLNVLDFNLKCPGKKGKMSWNVLECPGI